MIGPGSRRRAMRSWMSCTRTRYTEAPSVAMRFPQPRLGLLLLDFLGSAQLAPDDEPDDGKSQYDHDAGLELV